MYGSTCFDAEPATADMIEGRVPVEDAKHPDRLARLMWERPETFENPKGWVWMWGWYHAEWQKWVADCVLHGTYDLPAKPTHFFAD